MPCELRRERPRARSRQKQLLLAQKKNAETENAHSKSGEVLIRDKHTQEGDEARESIFWPRFVQIYLR